MSNTQNLTKKQKEAMKQVVRLAEISVQRLDRKNVGISIKTTDSVQISIVGNPLADLLQDLADCVEELGEKATMGQFKAWQAAKRKK